MIPPRNGGGAIRPDHAQLPYRLVRSLPFRYLWPTIDPGSEEGIAVTVLAFALLAALGNVVGGVAAARGARLGIRIISGFLAYSAGFMIAVALYRILPEALERGGEAAALYALGAYLVVHLSEHTATQHFNFGEETHAVSRAAGVSALVGMLLHTFFDGVAIASGFAVNPSLGTLMFLAVLLHKLPEGLAIASIQIAGGTQPTRAIGSAALLGVATVFGALVTDWVSFLTAHGLALSAGVTLYVGASNLVPELQGKRGLALAVAFVLGAASSVGLSRMLGLLGLH
jgi:ZIP family zinc transporter/zinc and cadmium transporter